MTAFHALRKATLLAALALLCSNAALAIDPARSPRNTEPIVPTPQDPFNYSPNGNGFSPFNPNGTFPSGTTQPGTSTTITNRNELRVTPQVIPQPPVQLPSEPPKWRLGIYSTDTGVGAQIVRVRDGSPANRAGLEEDDTIVSVNGHQVGYVNNVRHELGVEFNAHADTNGRVLLLVHNNRDGSLINIPVQLESRFERIQGTIGFQAGTRLPQNAQAHVALHEIIRQDLVVPIKTTTITDLNQRPVQFALEVDPAIIDPNREYVVHADITAGDRTLFTTRNAYRVLTAGYPKTVDMRVYTTATAGNGNGGQYNGYADNREEQLEQIVQWYRDYLHRDPYNNERAVYQSHIDRGLPLEEAQIDLLAHNEFYTQAQRDDEQYIENMYLAVLGKRPSQLEVDAWMKRLAARNGLRREIAKEFLDQVSKQR